MMILTRGSTSTNVYELAAWAATCSGLRPGSHDWWVELRRNKPAAYLILLLSSRVAA